MLSTGGAEATAALTQCVAHSTAQQATAATHTIPQRGSPSSRGGARRGGGAAEQPVRMACPGLCLGLGLGNEAMAFEIEISKH